LRASCSVSTQVPPSAAVATRLLRPRTTIEPAGLMHQAAV
jgi:hypothetical protein